MPPTDLSSAEQRWIKIASFLLFLRSLHVGHRARLYFSELFSLLFFCASVAAASNPLLVALPVVIVRVSHSIHSTRSDRANSKAKIEVTGVVTGGLAWIFLLAMRRVFPDSFIGRLWFIRLPGIYLSSLNSRMAYAFVVPAVHWLWLRHALYWLRRQLRFVWSLKSTVGGVILQDWVSDSARGLSSWWFSYSPFVRDASLHSAIHVFELLIGHFLWLVAARQYLGREWVPSLVPWRDSIAILSMAWLGSRHVQELCDTYRTYTPGTHHNIGGDHPDEATPNYTYTALSREKETIRLLLLHPRHRDDRISCSLFEAELAHAPRYEAISYRWVQNKDNERILVNNRLLSISANVFRLLQDFRSSLLPRIVWIDSICINQLSNEEKSHQVRLMGKIYSSASLVTIWLGSPPLDTTRDWMLDFLCRMRDNVAREVPPKPRAVIESWIGGFANRFQQDDSGGGGSPNKQSQKLHYRLAAAYFGLAALSLVDELRIDTLFRQASAKTYRRAAQYRYTPQWTPFMHLLSHEWFERVWVAQEVVLAPEVRLMYGRVLYNWEDFLEGLYIFASNVMLSGLLGWTKDEQKRTILPTMHVTNAATMQAWRARRMTKRSPTFKEVICSTRLMKATDARDKVFGVQGLAGDGRSDWTVPNYDKDVREVYSLAALRLVAENGAFVVLAYAGTGYVDGGHPGVVPGLRSWVPDWNAFPIAAPLGYVDGAPNYRAGGDGVVKVLEGYQLDEATLSLSLRGMELDVIAEVAPPLLMSSAIGAGAADYETSEHAALGGILDTSRETVLTSSLTRNPYQHTREPTPLEEVFWRILIGDRTETE
ncbi:heterokaryon incompatibility protein-domain-containing protein [Immersiella caudata]|uniref:Heterokaryon incompatibility protein-domain-containing protein n=1 Tax=Immersiella caudata TaxID=314043 RepID=A0AA39U6N4_9PEZI|nr:heterokaryon incompatibility protein-domain-containing protein [Immersiella caudata]